MLAEERFALILEQLNEQRTVTVQQLCEALHTSESTIRRDLTELDRQGRLTKVHGGATLPDSRFLADEPTMEAKETLAVAEKRSIAAAAAALIAAEDFVFTVDARKVYPEGLGVQCPIETWSDDFSVAISGIPSMVNEFSSAEFMETHYHSQFDNEDFYDEPVYRFHHNLYGKLVLAFDYTAVVPMDFERLFAAVEDSVEKSLCEKTQADETNLLERLKKAKKLGRQLYSQIQTIIRTQVLITILDFQSMEQVLILRTDSRILQRRKNL